MGGSDGSRSRHYMGEAYDMQVEREKARRELRERNRVWFSDVARLVNGEQEDDEDGRSQ